MKRQAFISYAKPDIKHAKRLAKDLERLGVEVWLDQDRLLPGHNWRDEIHRAIRASEFVIVLLSIRAVGRRGYVQAEIAEALKEWQEVPPGNIFLIPARLDDCMPAHSQLKDLQWVDLFPSWQGGVQRIAKAMGADKRALPVLDDGGGSKLKPTVHCVVIFPFPGIEIGSKSHQLFMRLLDQCRQSSGGANPIVVYDRRSRAPKDTGAILKKLGKSIDRVEIWGVDTCQDWLAGWGHVLDSMKPSEESSHRIALLPGDLVHVVNEDELFANLDMFIKFDGAPFLVGDFDNENPYSTKELIDTYGVSLLIANWFPEAWQAIQARHIGKPRSEFTNISVPELRYLLRSRAFAYEQTLNMLIVKWYSCLNSSPGNIAQATEVWRSQVDRMYLGRIADDPTDRHYRGAIDQIERTERLLRMLWRELRGWNPNLNLMEEYERLDERSTRIRDAARIALWAQLSRDQGSEANAQLGRSSGRQSRRSSA